MAIVALANAAGNADLLDPRFTFEIEAVRIDNFLRIGQFTSQSDGVSAHRCMISRAQLHDAGGHAQIAQTVRHFSDLNQMTARRFESLMNIPQRAGAAKTGKLEPCRGVAFSNVASPVDAQEIEGNAPRSGALHARQAMGDLLLRSAKMKAQPIDVMPCFPGNFKEALVGQAQSPCEIVGEPDPPQSPRGVRAETSLGNAEIYEVVILHDGNLMGQ